MKILFVDELVKVFGALTSDEERQHFLQAFLSPKELKVQSHRWAVFTGLLSGKTQRAVQAETKAGMVTITRAARQLNNEQESAVLRLLHARLYPDTTT